jgi:hypothetical protein
VLRDGRNLLDVKAFDDCFLFFQGFNRSDHFWLLGQLVNACLGLSLLHATLVVADRRCVCGWSRSLLCFRNRWGDAVKRPEFELVLKHLLGFSHKLRDT